MSPLLEKVKRLVAATVAEPLLSHRVLESYMVLLARLVYRVRKPYVIAVTGSVGKSTTTAMIAAVLSHPDAARVVGPVGHTLDNMNDDLGVSATLLRFEYAVELPWSYLARAILLWRATVRAVRALVGRYPRIMVLECGVGSTASLAHIACIAPPDVSIVTRIGAAHLEKLGTLEGIVREKGALVRAVAPSGLVILGLDHPYVDDLERLARAPVTKVGGRGIDLSRNITRVVCRPLHVAEATVAAALQGFTRPDGRLTVIALPALTVIDDTYNANPLSMKLALDTLSETAGGRCRRVAILGGMGELGEESAAYHEEIGAYGHRCADLVVGVGELARPYRSDVWFESSEACAERIAAVVRPHDCILVKGSAAARMKRVVAALQQLPEAAATGALAA
jgi:UDP-N-acetylmuramoyl-tripeptide--D-alanyl-D-alanine ligase